MMSVQGTGTLQQGIVEVGQVRMGATNPWDNHAAVRGAVADVPRADIKTPFMILHGTADNAVDWHQGLELFSAARRWGKEVILLSYPGEPHHLAKKENQKDFQRAHEAVLRSLPQGDAGAEVDDRRRAADEEGRTDPVNASANRSD